MQYLAGIQVARERRLEQRQQEARDEDEEEDEDEEKEEQKQAADDTPFGLEPQQPETSIWADEDEEDDLELPEDVAANSNSSAADREAHAALAAFNAAAAGGKRQKR